MSEKDKNINKEVLDRVEKKAYELVDKYHGCAQCSLLAIQEVCGMKDDLMAKDLSLCLSAADVTQFPLFTCSLAHQLLEAAKANGLGKKDCTVVNKIIRQLGGEKL